MTKGPFGQILAFAKRLQGYFTAYGGWKAVLGSPLFWVSILTTAVGYSGWIQPKWVEQTFTLIPSLLGFSLGTYAILFSLITNRMKRALRATLNRQGVSYLDEINATFFHFIFVQALSLLWAFWFSGTLFTDLIVRLDPVPDWAREGFTWLSTIGSFIGMLLLVYSIVLVIGSALAVYRLARIVDPED